MNKEQPIADWPVKELIAAIGSGHLTPGAGVAGAVALGLAAACAGKAALISLRHRPADAALQGAAGTCAEIGRLALLDADRDAHEFAQFMHSHSPHAATELIETGEALAALHAQLLKLIGHLESHLELSLKGDLFAARALSYAAREIQARNEAEATGK